MKLAEPGLEEEWKVTRAYSAAGPPWVHRCVISTPIERPLCRIVGVVGIISAWRCVCIFDGQRAVYQVRTRMGAEQGPALSPWCDVGFIVIVASMLTSEKRHDLSFGGKEGRVSMMIRRISNSFVGSGMSALLSGE